MAYLTGIQTNTNTDFYYRSEKHIQPVLASLGLETGDGHTFHENKFAAYIPPAFDTLGRHSILYRIGQTNERTHFAKGVGEWAFLNATSPKLSLEFLRECGSEELMNESPIIQTFASGLIAVRNQGLSIAELVKQLNERELTDGNRFGLDSAARYLV